MERFVYLRQEKPKNRAAPSGREILASGSLLSCENIAVEQRNLLVNIVTLIHREVIDSFMLFN